MNRRWMPAALLGVGALFTVGVDTQRTMPLRGSLESALPATLEGFPGTDGVLSEQERAVAGMSAYVVRTYAPLASQSGRPFSVYVGYYDRQTQGRTIHSPKNCLPGAGWEALASRTEQLATPEGTVTVNRYLIRKGTERALVLYWYQGRGRVQANEYRVKWDLLRDAVLRRRTEEALVRVVVPLSGDDEERATQLGARIVGSVVPALARTLPT